MTRILLVVALAGLSHPLAGQLVCGQRWSLEETLRIGSIDGADALAPVMDVEAGPDGAIYVTQVFTPMVTVFTPTGELSHTIGRSGSGPGEFRFAAVRLGWVGDTLWVTDRGFMHFFGPEGEQVRQVSFSTHLDEVGSIFRPGSPLGEGTYLGSRGLRGNMQGFLDATRVAIPLFDAEGTVVDTVAVVDQRPYVQAEDAGFTNHPLDDAAGFAGFHLAPMPDRRSVVFIGDRSDGPAGAGFDLVKATARGDTIWIRSVRYEPKPVSRDLRSWLTEGIAASFAGDYLTGPGTLQRDEATRERMRRAAREAIEFPDYHPPVRRIMSGMDGSIWILREMEYPELVDRWEVYDGDGQLIGVLTISDGRSVPQPWGPRVNVLRVSRDEVWGATMDEFDVPYIHRYRVVDACGG